MVKQLSYFIKIIVNYYNLSYNKMVMIMINYYQSYVILKRK